MTLGRTRYHALLHGERLATPASTMRETHFIMPYHPSRGQQLG